MIKKIFAHFFSFNGRSGRLEYFLHNFLGIVALFLFVGIMPLFASIMPDTISETASALLPLLFVPVMIGAMISELAITVRRLHDLDESGWNILMGMIPIYNIFQAFKLTFFEGTHCRNNYGLPPGEGKPEQPRRLANNPQPERLSEPLRTESKEKYKSPYQTGE